MYIPYGMRSGRKCPKLKKQRVQGKVHSCIQNLGEFSPESKIIITKAQDEYLQGV